MPSAHTSSDDESAEEDADFEDDSVASESEDNSQSDDSVDSEEGFEEQGSSSEDEDLLAAQAAHDSDEDEDEEAISSDEDGAVGGGEGGQQQDKPRTWSMASRENELAAKRKDGSLQVEQNLHIDDLSSDDEVAGNTIGRVPLRWYENYDHIGYDLEGKKIAKSKTGPAAGLAAMLAAKDDPNYRRTIYDSLNDREIVLSDRDLEIIRRIQNGAFAHPEYDAHPEYIPYYTADVEALPLSEVNVPKRRFTPSKLELMKVSQIVKGLRDGTIKPYADRMREQREAKKAVGEARLIWSADDEDELYHAKGPMHIAAPKVRQ